MIKRHTRPNPQRNIKGGIVEREASMHASNVQLVCPECGKPTRIGHKISATAARCASAASAREWSTNEPPEGTLHRRKSCRRSQKEFGYTNVMADPEDREGRRQHGARRGDAERQDDRHGADELGAHHRPEAGDTPGEKSIAQFKAARGHADRRDGHAARRADVRVPRPPDQLALPRVRDFRGVSPKGFDGRGNYTLGLATS